KRWVLQPDPAQAVLTEEPARHYIMNVRMKDELARPRVEHTQRSHFTSEFGDGCLAQSLRGHGKEQVITELRLGLEERAQFLGDGEGEQEVGHGQQTQLAFLEPVLGLERAALWTGAVMAGVIGELKLRARTTLIEMPAALRRAAGKQGAHGAALFARASRVRMRAQQGRAHRRTTPACADSHPAGPHTAG